MVVAERNESSSYGPGSTTTTNRRTRTLNSNITSANNSTSSNVDVASCSSDMNSDSDSKKSVRVGNEFQAEISDSCLPKPATDYPEKAVMVWTPYNDLDEDDLRDYIKLAEEKYNYNLEQALGILFWHDFNLKCALADLPNYAPYPDEWSMEDRALFEQAYQFHNKNFHKINQLLPDKKLSSIVKFYYTWKKFKTRGSYVDKQVRKANSQSKDEGPDDAMVVDYDNEVDASNSISNSASKGQYPDRKECSQCLNKTSNQYFNTKFGFLCKSCYGKRKNSFSKSLNNDQDQDTSRFAQQNEKLSKNFGSIMFDEIILNEIAKERLTCSTSKVLESYDHEIRDLTSKIRNFKQENTEKKSALSDLPDLSLLNQNNNNRIISRWTNEEILLMTQAIRDYGKDFKVIADIIGTKTEVQIKNYFLQNQEKMKLSNLIAELNEENDVEESDLFIVEDSYCENNNKANSKLSSK